MNDLTIKNLVLPLIIGLVLSIRRSALVKASLPIFNVKDKLEILSDIASDTENGPREKLIDYVSYNLLARTELNSSNNR